jgi:hypothetical protein
MHSPRNAVSQLGLGDVLFREVVSSVRDGFYNTKRKERGKKMREKERTYDNF